MPISSLPLPLSCTVNTVSTSIMENGETVHDKNNRIRVKIDIPSLAQHRTTLQLDTGYIGNSSTQQITTNTAEIEDVEDKDMIKKRPHQKSKRVRIKKKKGKAKFAGLIVEGVTSL